MIHQKKEHPKEKSELHIRNKHRERYNFKQLIESCPKLSQYVKVNVYDDESIDFFNPEAVKMLNKALLKYFYGIENWDIPPNYLCPPIPGRADYIHYMADLLGTCEKYHKKIPTGEQIKCLDIGVGANCVYPIIGNKEYGWSFIGADIDKIAIESAHQIIITNPSLIGKIELRLQTHSKNIFNGIIKEGEFIDLTICNPPFHTSFAEAQAGTIRKLTNLKQINSKVGNNKNSNPILNFGGQSSELWCEGGEEKFVNTMVMESKQFANSCFWFSSLISKQDSLESIYKTLKKVAATEVKTISMGQGNKTSRIVAWTFFSF